MNNTGQRPHQYEYSCISTSGDVIHYTCNAPSFDVMEKYGITSLKGLSCGDRGILVIPGSVFRKFGYLVDQKTDNNALKITAENLLTRLY